MSAENRVPVKKMFIRQQELQGDPGVRAFHDGKAPTYEGRTDQKAGNETGAIISPADLHRRGQENATKSISDSETDPSDDE